jgi:hypothetical protein
LNRREASLSSPWSKAISEALSASERRVDELRGELEVLRRYEELEIKIPPMVWIESRVAQLQELLERRMEKSAQPLRELLGKLRLKPTLSAKSRAHYRATSKLQVLSLWDERISPEDSGSKPLQWWRRRESNPRPEK